MSDDGSKSLIVSGDALQSDSRGIELVIFTAMAIGASWFLSEVLCIVIAKIAANSKRAGRYRDTINRYAATLNKFKRRRESLLQVVDQKTEGANTLTRQRDNLTMKLNKLNKSSNYFVREIGREAEGLSCYTFSVSNTYVIEYVAKGQKHPLLDDSWKSGQLVEVWASALMDARILIADRYSAKGLSR